MFRLKAASTSLVDQLSNRTSKTVHIITRSFKNSSSLYKEAAKEGVPPVRGISYSNLSIGVPREVFPKERRVALSPATVQTLVKKGFNVNVQENCGVEASFGNSAYEEAGAKVLKNTDEVFASNIVLKVRGPTTAEVEKLRPGSTYMSFLYPAQNTPIIDLLQKKNVSAFAMDCVPRISRAQVFDALSSMANISGYKAVLLSANHFGRFFTGEIFFIGGDYC